MKYDNRNYKINQQRDYAIKEYETMIDNDKRVKD